MPGRKTPLVTGEIYHVFNRGINKQPTFISKRDYERAKQTISFYKNASLKIKLSKFLKSGFEEQTKILKNSDTRKLVDVLAFVLMLNHFHLLLKQNTDKGISNFMSIFQNSYTRYFNTKHARDGSLFLDQFKALRVEKDRQLTHVHRYIHLNPYSSYVVRSFQDLIDYPWSSLKEYINKESKGICDRELINSFFKSTNIYIKFILDQADYQRSLENIKHLAFE